MSETDRELEILNSRVDSLEKSQPGFVTGFGVGLVVLMIVLGTLAGAKWLGLNDVTVQFPPSARGIPAPPPQPPADADK